MSDCDCFDCEFSATHWATWRHGLTGELCGGLYCPDHAEVLERAGDDVGPIIEPLRQAPS